jgi:hypothetical protein
LQACSAALRRLQPPSLLTMSPNTPTSRSFPSGHAAAGKKKNTAAPQLAYGLFGGSQDAWGWFSCLAVQLLSPFFHRLRCIVQHNLFYSKYLWYELLRQQLCDENGVVMMLFIWADQRSAVVLQGGHIEG